MADEVDQYDDCKAKTHSSHHTVNLYTSQFDQVADSTAPGNHHHNPGMIQGNCNQKLAESVNQHF